MSLLNPGFHEVPRGHVATIVTHLEMTAPPDRTPIPVPDAVALSPLGAVTPDAYRALFRAVGQDWLWFSRLRMDDTALTEILHDPNYDAFALTRAGQQVGLLELDFREPGACELAFFGLVPDAIGGGMGRYLMDQAITRAFERPITRFHVHTCTLDSPQALGFYRRSGFVPIRQQVEIAADPRVDGLMPRDAAPHVPLFD